MVGWQKATSNNRKQLKIEQAMMKLYEGAVRRLVYENVKALLFRCCCCGPLLAYGSTIMNKNRTVPALYKTETLWVAT